MGTETNDVLDPRISDLVEIFVRIEQRKTKRARQLRGAKPCVA